MDALFNLLLLGIPVTIFSFLLLRFTRVTPKIDRIVLLRDEFPSFDFTSFYDFLISTSKIVNEAIERWVLLKRSPLGYWNNVNVNLRFLGSLIISATVTFVVVAADLLEIGSSKWSVLSTFSAIFAAIFWQERTAFYEKWKYLAELYNEVLKCKPYVIGVEAVSSDVYSCRESLKIALAMDIVQMEMWSHSSFRSVFESCMIEAVKGLSAVKNRDEEFYIKLISGQMTKKDVLNTLSKYQSLILADEKKSYKEHAYTRAS
jgi:hypothetical protein